MGVYNNNNNNNNNNQTTTTSTSTTTNNASNESTNTPSKVSGKTKLVVRGLPHNLSQDGFLSIIEERFKDRYVNFYYVPGKQGYKVNTPSRAYIYFKDVSSAYDFLTFFDGHTFVNSKGQEERAQVEYAPYQKNFKPRRKPDPKTGTIEKDPDFLRFQQKLLEPEPKLPSAEIQLEKKMREESTGTAAPTPTSALLEDLKARRAAKLFQINNPGARGVAPITSIRKMNPERTLERKKLKKMEKERERKKRKEEKLIAKLQQQQLQQQGPNAPTLIANLSDLSSPANAPPTMTTNITPSTTPQITLAQTTQSQTTAPFTQQPQNEIENTYEKKKKQPLDWKRNREDRRKKKEERDTGNRKYNNTPPYYNQPHNAQNPPPTQAESNPNNNNASIANTNTNIPSTQQPTTQNPPSFPKQIRSKNVLPPKSKPVLEPGSITIQARPSSTNPTQTPTIPSTQPQSAPSQTTIQPSQTSSQTAANPTQTAQPNQPQSSPTTSHANTEQNYGSTQGTSQYYQKGYRSQVRGRSKYNAPSNQNTHNNNPTTATTNTTTTTTTTAPPTSHIPPPPPVKASSEQPQQASFSSNLSSSAPSFVPSSVTLAASAAPFTPSSKPVEPSLLSKPVIATKSSTFSLASTVFTPSSLPSTSAPQTTVPTTITATTATPTIPTTTQIGGKPSFPPRRTQQGRYDQNYSQYPGYPQQYAAAGSTYPVNPPPYQYPNVQYEQYGTVYYPPPAAGSTPAQPTPPVSQPYQYPAKPQGRYQNFME
eukprot:TRINITY_DN2458_c0_g2_i1.p1 TRINITY_DN2458_c0_g2~~TRINITY_DN2458_c0_g2_i1.p1  ORF type:complete len:764 (+),score=237.35 TRINITY_DN2458_c0_g2_i1:108-2399(+)